MDSSEAVPLSAAQLQHDAVWICLCQLASPPALHYCTHPPRAYVKLPEEHFHALQRRIQQRRTQAPQSVHENLTHPEQDIRWFNRQRAPSVASPGCSLLVLDFQYSVSSRKNHHYVDNKFLPYVELIMEDYDGTVKPDLRKPFLSCLHSCQVAETDEGAKEVGKFRLIVEASDQSAATLALAFAAKSKNKHIEEKKRAVEWKYNPQASSSPNTPGSGSPCSHEDVEAVEEGSEDNANCLARPADPANCLPRPADPPTSFTRPSLTPAQTVVSKTGDALRAVVPGSATYLDDVTSYDDDVASASREATDDNAQDHDGDGLRLPAGHPRASIGISYPAVPPSIAEDENADELSMSSDATSDETGDDDDDDDERKYGIRWLVSYSPFPWSEAGSETDEENDEFSPLPSFVPAVRKNDTNERVTPLSGVSSQRAPLDEEVRRILNWVDDVSSATTAASGEAPNNEQPESVPPLLDVSLPSAEEPESILSDYLAAAPSPPRKRSFDNVASPDSPTSERAPKRPKLAVAHHPWYTPGVYQTLSEMSAAIARAPHDASVEEDWVVLPSPASSVITTSSERLCGRQEDTARPVVSDAGVGAVWVLAEDHE